MDESNDLVVSGGKRLHLADHSYILWPAYTGVSSDTAVATVGDGGEFRLAVLGFGVGAATITVTRASDGATADVEVTVAEGGPLPGFEVHLGDSL